MTKGLARSVFSFPYVADQFLESQRTKQSFTIFLGNWHSKTQRFWTPGLEKRAEIINIGQKSYQLQRYFSQERPTLLRADIKCPNVWQRRRGAKWERKVCSEEWRGLNNALILSCAPSRGFEIWVLNLQHCQVPGTFQDRYAIRNGHEKGSGEMLRSTRLLMHFKQLWPIVPN